MTGRTAGDITAYITGVTVKPVEDSEHWPDAHKVTFTEPEPEPVRTVAVDQHWTDRRGRDLVVVAIGYVNRFDPDADDTLNGSMKALVRNVKTGRRSKINMARLLGHQGYWPVSR